MADATPTPDLQDPLPESSWFWRRVFVYIVTGCVLWMLWGAIDRLGEVAKVRPDIGVDALLSLCKWIICFTGALATYYLVAPSAEQVVKLVQVATLLRSGVQMAGRKIVEDESGRIEEARTVGKPPAPPVPPVGAQEAPPAVSSPGSADDGPPWAGQKENK